MKIKLSSKNDTYLLETLPNQYVIRKYKKNFTDETVKDNNGKEVSTFSNANYFANLEQVINFLITQEILQSDVEGIKNLNKFVKEFSKSIREQFEQYFKADLKNAKEE